MKITHVLFGYHPSVGGTQIFYKGISENCVAWYKDEVEVLTTNSYYGPHTNSFREISIPEETINGVLVKRYPFRRNHKKIIGFLNKLVAKITNKQSNYFIEMLTGPLSKQFFKALNSTNADVISASSLGYKYMQYPLYRHTLKTPKPFVFQGAIHFKSDEHDGGITPKMLQAIKASEYYLCNTAYEKNRLTALGVNQENIVITGCPVNITQYENAKGHEVRKQLNLSSNDVLIGYIGRLEATKSIPVLINAFEAAFQKNNQLHLVIAGFETAYLKQLKQIVAKLDANIQCKISFLISISENEKANLFQAIDVLVLPSTNESFGIVFLEAWACKKPVIGTAIGAVSSVISNGTDGLLMQPYNTIDLTEKILQLSNDKNLREFMGANGYNKVIQNYTWEIVTKKFRDTYVAAIEKFKKNNF